MNYSSHYRDELRFLRESGEAFCSIHPQLTRFLKGSKTDPDVERLLEGFAFLTARLHQKVEDEFPELTHSLFNMLWPNYLRPLPSMTIMEFAPIAGQIKEKQIIPKEIYIDSGAPDLPVNCRFSTSREVTMFPVTCSSADSIQTRENSTISITLQSLNDQSLAESGLDTMRFFLAGDKFVANSIYLWLFHYLQSVSFVVNGKQHSFPTTVIKKVGLDKKDSILPYPKNVHDGYRVIQEYFSYEEGFLFFDVEKLDKVLAFEKESTELVIELSFSKTLPFNNMLSHKNFLLYCTPALNLFSKDSEPLDVNGLYSEYKIIPSSSLYKFYEVFSVEKVQSWKDDKKGGRKITRTYQPFEGFHHEVERANNRLALYYRVRVRESLRDDGFDHFVSFIREDEQSCTNIAESVSLEMLCTNRELPTTLGKGDIFVATENSPVFATCANITEPTAPLRPLLDGSLMWQLLSNFSLNYLSLLSKEGLSAILRTYDFNAHKDGQAEQVARLRLQSIKNIESTPIDRIVRGLPIRGVQSTITLQENGFASEGSLYLFGTILSQFFALYANINSFHQLTIINADNKEKYTWPTQIGQQHLI